MLKLQQSCNTLCMLLHTLPLLSGHHCVGLLSCKHTCMSYLMRKCMDCESQKAKDERKVFKL